MRLTAILLPVALFLAASALCGSNCLRQIAFEKSQQTLGGTRTFNLAAGDVSAVPTETADDVYWRPLGSGVNSYVAGLMTYNSAIVVGGDFTIAGGLAANRIATWDGANWSALGSGMDSSVNALVLYNGMLVAGGRFTVAGGISANRIAIWDGTSWGALGSGMNGAVWALAVYDGKLIAGGQFTAAGGNAVGYIAAWDGNSWAPLGTGVNGWVQGMCVVDNELIVAGWFSSSGGVSTKGVSFWNGTEWSGLGTGLGGTQAHGIVPIVYDAGLVVGGSFATAGGKTANSIAIWDGIDWSVLSTGTTGSVSALTDYECKLAVGGFFTSAGGVPASNVAFWDGGSWSSLGSGTSGPIWAQAVFDGKLVVGGLFSSAGGKTVNNIAYWHRDTCHGTVTDIDGNVYGTVTIGAQVWMIENLKVTRYRNGEAIPNVTDPTTWEILSTGASCVYGNDADKVATYGKLYNWHAAADRRNIAPVGWHVATDADWKQLEMYLGMSQAQADQIGWRGTAEGGKLKESGTVHWLSPNIGATDETEFSGLPGGYRYEGGVFDGLGIHGVFWTSTEFSGNFGWCRGLGNSYSGIHRFDGRKVDGFSVRCVKNSGCCDGATGNVDCDPADGADISDLSALIDNLYVTFTPLCCPNEANTDGQPGTDISDLSALIDYLYTSFTPVALCN